MDAHDQGVIEQQADNLRRQQQLDNQRRLEEQQRREHEARELRQRELDDEELAEQQRAERRRRLQLGEQQEVEDEEREAHQHEQDKLLAEQERLARPRRNKLWPFNTRAASDAPDDDEDSEGDELAPSDAPEHHQALSTSSGGGGIVFWLLALVLIVAVGAWSAPKWFNSSWFEASAKKHDAASPAVAPPLALATPEDKASALTPAPAGLAAATAAPVAPTPPEMTAAALPTVPKQSDHTVASPTQEPSTSQVIAATEPAADSPLAAADAMAPARQDDDSRAQQIAVLSQRVARLEAELAARDTHSHAAPAVAHPAPKPRPARVVTKTPASPPVATPTTNTVPKLLAIDMWDGRPSVVIGTSAPGDQRVRILQPGESLNGIGLESADAATGRATFTVGAGQRVTLQLNEGATP